MTTSHLIHSTRGLWQGREIFESVFLEHRLLKTNRLVSNRQLARKKERKYGEEGREEHMYENL